MKIECRNCKYRGNAKYGRSLVIELFLLLFAVLPLILYYALKPRWICPRCGSKNIMDQRFMDEESTEESDE